MFSDPSIQGLSPEACKQVFFLPFNMATAVQQDLLTLKRCGVDLASLEHAIITEIPEDNLLLYFF